MSKSNIKLKMTKERLQKYYDCEEKILQGQSYTIGSRSLTRANLAEVQGMIAKLEDVKYGLLYTRVRQKGLSVRQALEDIKGGN